MTVFCAAILGAGLGFLWYNCYPASVFMGDVGSLALGGALGTVALLIKKELLLVVIGGVFVIEALSVILQVASFRLTGKRIFKIAPLHHHFQILRLAGKQGDHPFLDSGQPVGVTDFGDIEDKVVRCKISSLNSAQSNRESKIEI